MCSECGRQYATSSNLSRHKQTHRSLADSRYARACPHCHKTYVSMPALAMHVLTHDLKSVTHHLRHCQLMHPLGLAPGHLLRVNVFCSVLFFSRTRTEGWPHRVTSYFLHLSLSSVILIDSSITGSPVHILMLSIQAVRGLPRLRAPGIVPCIISYSRQLPCFLMV